MREDELSNLGVVEDEDGVGRPLARDDARILGHVARSAGPKRWSKANHFPGAEKTTQADVLDHLFTSP